MNTTIISFQFKIPKNNKQEINNHQFDFQIQ